MKLFKSILCLSVVMGLLVTLTGCPISVKKAEPKGMVYYTYFDTVSYIYSYADDSESEFQQNCDGAAEILEDYHQLFDIYHEYTGINNLCTINANAGGEALTVDEKLMDFLLYAKQIYSDTNGEVNIMMGAVLRPWHDCRTAAGEDPASASIPTQDQLQQAALHIDFDALELDVENCTVRIADPEASIDVGALGKGYATQKAAEYLRGQGVTSYVLNIGGNICIIGSKPDGTGWATGIKNPVDPNYYALKVELADVSCVTSGNYERFFTVDNVRYHHVIDQDTLMPSEHFASVTIITKDSALADALSTALFCMNHEDGLALVEKIGGVDVLWITEDGTQYMTDGLSSIVVE